jgi:hypothetical protein
MDFGFEICEKKEEGRRKKEEGIKQGFVELRS